MDLKFISQILAHYFLLTPSSMEPPDCAESLSPLSSSPDLVLTSNTLNPGSVAFCPPPARLLARTKLILHEMLRHTHSWNFILKETSKRRKNTTACLFAALCVKVKN